MDIVVIGLLILGLVFLIGGAELLVRGASELAIGLGVSPLLVGLTVVSIGTSAPELAVGVTGALSYNATGDAAGVDVAVGNVLGSNIANVLLILGIGAVITPLIVQRQLLKYDLPVMVIASIVLLSMSLDGTIYQLDGVLLVAAIVAYIVWLIFRSRTPRSRKPAQAAAPTDGGATDGGATDDRATGAPPKVIPTRSVGYIVRNLLFIAVGLFLLVVGSDWLVDGATALARGFGVSELLIGLTVVAVGTSLPEIATTVSACLRGKVNIAVGNAVGSNIFNILMVLGGSSLVSSIGLRVNPAAIAFDFPVMIVVALLCLPVFYSGWQVSRLEGGIFLLLYLLYVSVLITGEVAPTLLDEVSTGVAVISGIAAGSLVYQAFMAWRRGNPDANRRTPQAGAS